MVDRLPIEHGGYRPTVSGPTTSPTLLRALTAAATSRMTPAEMLAQRISFIAGQTGIDPAVVRRVLEAEHG